ncbi:hypothetical protein ACIPEP_10540 [Curtobacterium sp. NPDC087082]|uniref:hypothetical protein n=1 Tax=Curtobacterium sp. NPDC087082 TaxID=3363966 RepID=UPI003808C279
MTPRTGTTAQGDESFRRGRLAKATEFLDAADTLRELGGESGVLTSTSPFANAFVVQCVLSGIAAADAICVAKHLEVLLAVKNKAEYNAKSVSDTDIVRAGAAAEALESAARSD